MRCLACVVALLLLATSRPGAGRDVQAASPSVAWQARDIDGRPLSAATLRGQVVVLDFWATWCAPCLEDIPRLARLHARYGTRGLAIVGISLDQSAARDFRSWLQRQGVTWPQVRERGGYDSPMARQFLVDALPASYVYGRDGRLVATQLRGQDLEHLVVRLMETP